MIERENNAMLTPYAHQVPRGLQVDEVVNMGQHAMHMGLVKEEM